MKLSCLPVSFYSDIIAGRMSLGEWARMGVELGLDAVNPLEVDLKALVEERTGGAGARLMIGVVIGLLVLRSYFGFMTLLGIISLAGVVINVLADALPHRRRPSPPACPTAVPSGVTSWWPTCASASGAPPCWWAIPSAASPPVSNGSASCSDSKGALPGRQMA